MTDDDRTRIEYLERRADELQTEVVTRARMVEGLRESENNYRHLFEANPFPMWVYDVETLRFLAVNDAAVEHYGYSRARFLAMTIADIRPDHDLAALHASVAMSSSSGLAHSGIWRHRRSDGTIIEVEITSHEFTFSGRLARLVLANDVTQRLDQERKISRLNRIRAITAAMTSAMLRLHDRDALLQEACRVATTEGVFAFAWIRFIDRSINDAGPIIWHGEPGAHALLERFLASEAWPESDRPSSRAAQGRRPVVINDMAAEPMLYPVRQEMLRHELRSCAAFPLFAGGAVVAVLVLLAKEQGVFDAGEIELLDLLTADLSYALESIEKSRQLEYVTSHDILTGLPNAHLFAKRLEQFVNASREESSSVCVIAIDLERFTQINDSLGRDVGDGVLREVAHRFRGALKEPYALARIGADTFAAAIPSHVDLTRLPDRLLDALQRPFEVSGQEVILSAQAGVALFPTDGADGGIVFKNAEAALKHAKSSGQRCEYYSSEMNARIAERRLLGEQLRAAIAAREFVLYYQPRVDVVSGKLVGAEALIRWQHPTRGIVSPSNFIPIAEETGLIVPIGAWAIDEVCRQQTEWLADGVRIVPMAVNLSSVQLDRADLLKVVREALAAHRLDSKYLELELTESAVMNDPFAAATTLRALREIGVSLALDDFGTGYSSLALLKRFPFRSVKIDQSFVMEVTRNADDAAIANAIIAMAHQLALKVVAEGVETEGQWNYLRLQGCDEMQGSLFGAAAPVDTFESLLRGHVRLPVLKVPATDRRTLLLVDDEAGIRSALTRMLRKDGYRILTASSGAEALDVLAVNPVQVIISDQRMPGMSGTEFLAIVKQLYPDTVRIILSGYTDLQVVTESVNQGAVFKFLTKPWSDDLLREQVRDAFRRF